MNPERGGGGVDAGIIAAGSSARNACSDRCSDVRFADAMLPLRARMLRTLGRLRAAAAARSGIGGSTAVLVEETDGERAPAPQPLATVRLLTEPVGELLPLPPPFVVAMWARH